MAVRWTGLDAYEAELEALPTTAATQVGSVNRAQAEAAAADVRSSYPVMTGTLRAGLVLVDKTEDPLTPRYQVRNDVIYARAFESGGQSTAGPLAAGKVFVPIVRRHQRLLRPKQSAVLVGLGATRVRDDG